MMDAGNTSKMEKPGTEMSKLETPFGNDFVAVMSKTSVSLGLSCRCQSNRPCLLKYEEIPKMSVGYKDLYKRFRSEDIDFEFFYQILQY